MIKACKRILVVTQNTFNRLDKIAADRQPLIGYIAKHSVGFIVWVCGGNHECLSRNLSGLRSNSVLMRNSTWSS